MTSAAGFDASNKLPVLFSSNLGPSAPEIVSVKANSSSSIYVDWKRPETWYKPIDMYYIRYQAYGSDLFRETTLYVTDPSQTEHGVSSECFQFLLLSSFQL